MDNIPESVREQERRVKELVEELNRNKSTQGAPTDGDSTDDTEGDGQEQLVDTNADPGFGESGGEEITPQEPKERTDYKAMYHTLKGKYDAEVPRLHSTMNALQKRTVDLENMLARQEPDDEGDPAANNESFEITDEEREAFGDDLLSVVQKQAQRVMLGREKEYLQQIGELKSQLGQVGQKVKTYDNKSFYADLEKQVPDFAEINVDPGFLAWLEEVDPYSGERKINLLRSAGAQHDVMRTASFFNVYKSLSRRSAPAKANPLEKQISPSRGAAGELVGKSARSNRVFSKGDVAKFYRDVVEGRYKGRDSERQKLENEIITAGREGRIE